MEKNILIIDKLKKLFDRENFSDETMLDYLLLRILPAHYTYDGINNEMVKRIDADTLFWQGTVWYLNNGQCLIAAIEISAKLGKNGLNYELYVTSEKRFKNSDKLWKVFYIFTTSDDVDFEWDYEETGQVKHNM